MDLEFTAEDLAFRDEVRAFIAEAFAREHDVAALILRRAAGGYEEVLTPAFERLLA